MKIDLFATQIEWLKSLMPWNQLEQEKKALRGIMEQRRRIIPPEQVHEFSETIVNRIEQMRHFQEAEVIVLYYPIHNEVDVKPLIEKYWQTKTILLPVAHRHRKIELRPYRGEELMRRGKYNIPVPLTENYSGKIDLIIVPGVAFDEHCNRLGRGGGYYDKFLRRHHSVYTLGVCYDCQIRKHQDVPHSDLDKPVAAVVTPTQVYREA